MKCSYTCTYDEINSSFDQVSSFGEVGEACTTVQVMSINLEMPYMGFAAILSILSSSSCLVVQFTTNSQNNPTLVANERDCDRTNIENDGMIA